MIALIDLVLGQPWQLQAAVFGASLLQAATGIGFGIIAGPIFLVAMNDGAAIQVSILLSFLIAVVLSPSAIHNADKNLLHRIALGSVFGAVVGVTAFTFLNITALKILAGLAVLFMALASLGFVSCNRAAGTIGIVSQYLTGVISGSMSAALAMPGPVIAALMTAHNRGKASTRATVLTLFLVSYPLALAAQYAVIGISSEAIELSLALVPATLAGVASGVMLITLVPEQVFRFIIVVVLFATAVVLFTSI